MTTQPGGSASIQPAIPGWMVSFLATACGLMVANIYYAQPLTGPISAEIGLPAQAAGLIVTMTQIGFGAGLLLIVPLGDLFENRRLVLSVMALCVAALLGVALSTHPLPFLAAALALGLGSVTVQILVPYASHLAPQAVRGRVVGNVMSGVMLGIMLARPVAGFVTEIASWHAVFFGSSVVMVLLAAAIRLVLPRREPSSGLRYGELLASMGHLAWKTPVLQRRALYHAFLFGAFSLFWTASPLWLAGPDFRLSHGGIALFALAGVSGAIAAPITGAIADRGWSRPATGLAMLAAAVAFLLTHLGPPGSALRLGILVAAAILLDFGVTANMVVGQRAIFSLGAEFRSRLNGLYMATFFVGGALGSALGGWAYARGGWTLASWAGFALPLAALLAFCTEFRPKPASAELA
ncbi:MAG: MFS transporter [Chthoniobacteraceae bacterium]|nr:MFS transporter [Chthoniobacteraceae bacterium]